MIDREQFRKIRKKLKDELSKSRYEHTLGVEFTSAAMAMKFGADIEKAQLAGLLHDCAKCIDDEEKLDECKKYGVDISDVERRNPFLIHSKLGAVYAKEKYGVDDEEILSAITYHTTGRPDMSFIEKIVFIADYIEPGRNKAKNLVEQLYTYYKKRPEKLPEEYKNICRRFDIDRAVCDYISGMSDGYAIDLYNELFVPCSWK